MASFPQSGGIYAVTVHSATVKFVYIGSSRNLARRRQQHLRELRAGKHHSTRLQQKFEQYGEEALTFSVLEHAAEFPVGATLEEREDYFLAVARTLLPREQILNTRITANCRKGRVNEASVVKLCYTKNPTSYFRGVSFEAESQSWRVQGRNEAGRVTTIHRCNCQLEAALAYDEHIRASGCPEPVCNFPLAGEPLADYQREALERYYASQGEKFQN